MGAAHGRWIVKTEPSTYAFDDLLREGRTVWSGVRNAQALIHLRAVAVGDDVLVYHSGADKALVGLARVARGPYPDPDADDPRLVAVDLAAVCALPRPIPLAEIKARPALAGLALVRHGRLSVMPASAAEWTALLQLASPAAVAGTPKRRSRRGT